MNAIGYIRGITVPRKVENRSIENVVIYKGHEKGIYFGPYPENIQKRIKMFNVLNHYREKNQQMKWEITAVAGEDLVRTLKQKNYKKTLLVIPAGQSSNLDKAFSLTETQFLKEEFFFQGGLGYFNCGSAYWISQERIYHDLCQEQPEKRLPIRKTTQLPLFQGTTEGPLCPFPGKKYKVGFFSDAVSVCDGKTECNIFLSGGGSFILNKQLEKDQKVKVLARYLHSELIRHGKKPEECKKWENAAIMVSIGEGAALLASYHPYYGDPDFDVDLYERNFPDCGTNWKEVAQKLSPLDVRMNFVLKMINQLEARAFDADLN